MWCLECISNWAVNCQWQTLTFVYNKVHVHVNESCVFKKCLSEKVVLSVKYCNRKENAKVNCHNFLPKPDHFHKIPFSLLCQKIDCKQAVQETAATHWWAWTICNSWTFQCPNCNSVTTYHPLNSCLQEGEKIQEHIYSKKKPKVPKEESANIIITSIIRAEFDT